MCMLISDHILSFSVTLGPWKPSCDHHENQTHVLNSWAFGEKLASNCCPQHTRTADSAFLPQPSPGPSVDYVFWRADCVTEWGWQFCVRKSGFGTRKKKRLHHPVCQLVVAPSGREQSEWRCCSGGKSGCRTEHADSRLSKFFLLPSHREAVVGFNATYYIFPSPVFFVQFWPVAQCRRLTWFRVSDQVWRILVPQCKIRREPRCN